MPRVERQLRAHSRMFSAVHSHHLVYVTCWEDPAVDRAALDLMSDDHVLTITSGGCNALDLLLTAARTVSAVDINPMQTALMEFRVAAIRGLDDAAVFALFGAGHSTRAAEMYRDVIRDALSPSARRYWDRHLDYFSGRGWRNSFLYRGSAGVVHKVLRDYAFQVRGLAPAIEELIAAPTLEEQRELYRQHQIRERFMTPVLRWLLSRDMLLALLGIPGSQRREMEQNRGGTVGYALDVIEAAFTRVHLRTNYFWRGVLEGHYSPDCCPEYLKPENLERLRGGLLDKLHFETASITKFLLSGKSPAISKFILLDHMDWLGNHDLAELSEEWGAIFNRAKPGARVIFRSAGHEVSYLQALQVRIAGRNRPLTSLLTFERELATRLHATDRTCIYGSFHIADLHTEH